MLTVTAPIVIGIVAELRSPEMESPLAKPLMLVILAPSLVKVTSPSVEWNCAPFRVTSSIAPLIVPIKSPILVTSEFASVVKVTCPSVSLIV